MSAPTANLSVLLEGRFAQAATLRRKGGGSELAVRGLWEVGEIETQTTTLEDGVSTTHRLAQPHFTVMASKGAGYGEGDEIIHDSRTHTILDVITDGDQTTFVLTK